MRVALLVALAAFSGCALPSDGPAPPATRTVDPPPDGGGFAECRTSAAKTIALPMRARAVDSAEGRAVGLHRLNETRFLWVWASYEGTLREDKVTRIQDVSAYREPEPSAPVTLCARVDVAAPIEVDAQARSYDVAVLFEMTGAPPPGALRFVVNWLAGCPCATPPSGNATALFE